MGKQLTYEEAMQQKSFYLVGYGIVDYKDFYNLLSDLEVANLLSLEAKKRTAPHNTLAYYVNNVTSIHGSPTWVGSFACDISYRVTNDTKEDLSELIGFIIDEMWYFDYVDENDSIVGVNREVSNRKIDLFINRLDMWFGCIMKDGRKLPRGRWIDNHNETTST